jgi:hypothetical protein
MAGTARVIGIDFDNTLISYDVLFHGLALEAGLIGAAIPVDKRAIRDEVRRSAQGDQAWQALQGTAYGPRIGAAAPAPGAKAFIAQCQKAGLEVLIISHKTDFATVDPTRTPLRRAAMDWLGAQGLGGLPVRFGATRAEKLEQIRAAGCTHFIDDLEETFREPAFPAGVQGILYAPGGAPAPDLPGLVTVRSWAEIGSRLFGA